MSDTTRAADSKSQCRGLESAGENPSGRGIVRIVNGPVSCTVDIDRPLTADEMAALAPLARAAADVAAVFTDACAIDSDACQVA